MREISHINIIIVIHFHPLVFCIVYLQLGAITVKYEELKNKLTTNTNNVANELTGFVEDVMKVQRSKVERANELLKSALNNKVCILVALCWMCLYSYWLNRE